mgnify:CR=1 FL=1
MKALLGQKVGMTQIFDENGNARGVTVIAAGPCVVTQVKTQAKDGYNAVQIGFGEAKHQPKPQQGHLKAAKSNARWLKEVRIESLAAEAGEAEVEATQEDMGLKIGDSISVAEFQVGDVVSVTGTSKGKGFAGTIKRHNFHRGPKTHGSHNYRAPGSIGSAYPQRVFKGIKMAGRMGHEQVSVKNLKVAAVDETNNLIALAGAVPGPRKGLVMLRGKDE